MPHFRKSPSHGSQVTEAVSCLRLQRRTGSHHCHLHLHKHHHLHLNHQFLIIIIVIIIIVIIIIVTLSSSPSSSSSTDVCLDSGQPLHRVVYCGFLVRQSVIQNVTQTNPTSTLSFTILSLQIESCSLLFITALIFYQVDL